MRISDWSSDVCSSDLPLAVLHLLDLHQVVAVVAGAVKTQATVDGFHTVLAQESGNRLVIQAVGAAPAGFQHQLGRVRRRGMQLDRVEIGRASGRVNVCQPVYSTVVAVQYKQKTQSKACT